MFNTAATLTSEYYGCDLIRHVNHNSTSEWPLDIEFKSLLHEGECNSSNATALWWHFYVTSLLLRHQSLRSKESMAETKESTMEDENNVTSNVTSDADTDAEPQEDLGWKGGTGIPSFGFGLQSQTPTRQRQSAKHATNKLLLETQTRVAPLAWLEEHTIDTYTLSRFGELDLWVIQMREHEVASWQFFTFHQLISGTYEK